MPNDNFDQPLCIGPHRLMPGQRQTIDLPVGHLVTHQVLDLTVHVRRGEKPGPRLLVTAAIHGDEINGTEAIRRLLNRRMRHLAGDLILIPVVNLPAFVNRSRYLPDRRDLNRLFPGSKNGSFGARLADLLTKEIANQCTHAIDLHTGAVNRPNLPQIRYSDDVPGAKELAEVFCAPVTIASTVREGSFRDVFGRQGMVQLMYEGGEAGILEPAPVQLAINGVLSVMRHLQMLPQAKRTETRGKTVFCEQTTWQRAPRGGLFLPSVNLGAFVEEGMILGKIGDPLGRQKTPIFATHSGVVIGRLRNGVIDEGDGIFHIGLTRRVGAIAKSIQAAEADLDHGLDHPVFDEDVES
ncbi:succinylglutamate desuccinylase/aspartoacylase family protein [Crateriforma spongiae]|uniref:succinylglutamate desuccinylase/aspartoacylase family protein n=1 Tax=Crateriforma spongiae TaxID=2724528 RepID=UPI001446E724|nr:succinylglutamate desuccinylase/aspartoacylase family protein [Crateriforma spongiae]